MPSIIGFLQRFLGYCLTGHVHEHVLVFLSGTGGNGKGVFMSTVAGIFGDYAITAPMEMFLASNVDRHPTEIAKLMGARLVVAHETQKGRRWDEAKIKNLTGGDTLTGRFMRGDFFDFKPTHKLMIAGNHKPSLAQRRRSDPPPISARAVHRLHPGGRARPAAGRQAQGRVARDPAMDDRRLP